MFSRIHSKASVGVMPQFVGQVETTSTSEYPTPSIWFWNAFFIAFFALRMFFGESTVTRSRYATPSSELSSSHTRTGYPAVETSRPYGDVCVT